MKRSILLLLTLLSSCSLNSFGSKIEAERACKIWEESGIYYRYKDIFRNGLKQVSNRSCEYDEETRQFLGWKHYFVEFEIEANKIYESNPPNKKVEKRFYY